LSIVRNDLNPTGATSVSFTVTFDQSVTGVDSNDFELTTTNLVGASISDVSGSDDIYTITVGTGTGNGTIRLDVLDDDSILDIENNSLGGTGLGNGNFITGEKYNIVHGASVLYITRNDITPTNEASVSFSVSFDRSVTGVDISDFVLATTGGITGASITDVSGLDDFYVITVNTGSGNGTIRLDLLDDDSILDSANDPLGGTGISNGDFTTGEIYDVIKSTSSTYKSTGTQDGWILESSETSNKGGTLNSTATLLYVGDNAQDKQYKSILSFNTTNLPDNAVITKVQVKIKVQGFVGGNMFSPTKTLGNLLMDIRKPYFGTSAGLVAGDFQAGASKNSVGVLNSVPGTGWHTVTLKNTAWQYINLTGTTQLRLRFQKDDNDDLGNDYLKIYSGNAPTANQPQLIVEYYVP